MKLPERPPDWLELVRTSSEPFQIVRDPEGRKIVQRANAEYWHWDQLRRRPSPKRWKREIVWAAVKLARTAQVHEIGLRSTAGEPFWFWLPQHVLEILHEIDLGLAGTIGFNLPESASRDRQRYLVNSLMEEAIASSQIEGAATTRKVAKEMLRSKRQPRTHGERMIVNNYRTIRMLSDLKDRPLSVDLITEMQRSMTVGTLDNSDDEGRIRTARDHVRVVDGRDGEVLHNPPKARELPGRLESLCKFANHESDTGFLHPVVRAILVHFWLAYDHPFVDGNGRTARALFYWLMLRNGYWMFEFLPISRIINQAPVKYGRAFLYAESDESDATYFIMFHLRAIRQALRDLHAYLDRRQEEIQEARRLVRVFPNLNHRQVAVLREAVSDPRREFTIAAHQSEYCVSYGTAYADLTGLVKQRMMVRRRLQGRQWVFFADDDLARRLRGPKRANRVP